MLKRKALLIAAISALSISVNAFAADAASKPKLEKISSGSEALNPWTDCGIGAMIFDETKWAAVTSNIIWDLGTTAVTSNISSKNVCEGKRVVAAVFINQTYTNIEEQTANGNGAHLTAMLNILGCDSAAQEPIVNAIRADFSHAVADPAYAGKSATDKAQQYYFMVNKQVSGEYATQCRAS